jgi:hypothetical protein
VLGLSLYGVDAQAESDLWMDEVALDVAHRLHAVGGSAAGANSTPHLAESTPQ